MLNSYNQSTHINIILELLYYIILVYDILLYIIFPFTK